MVNSRSFEDIGNFIFVSDEPEKSDLIIIPGTVSGGPELTKQAAKLWKEGYAPKIMVTGRYSMHVKSFMEEAEGKIDSEAKYETEADYLYDLLIKEGVSEDAIIKENGSTNTFENAKKAYRKASDLGISIKKIILCCKAYHARRALMTFQSEFIRSRILVCPVVVAGIEKATWMESASTYDRVLDELSKCGKFFAGVKMFGKVFPYET
ncbi:MAG: YdcF family protein [Butyrivibrio sp.]|nr:YdcF family protein [Butyrivibrio sp.]